MNLKDEKETETCAEKLVEDSFQIFKYRNKDLFEGETDEDMRKHWKNNLLGYDDDDNCHHPSIVDIVGGNMFVYDQDLGKMPIEF